MNADVEKAVESIARKAFAFDAMIAAGRITQELADESLALADGPIELTDATTIRQTLRDQEAELKILRVKCAGTLANNLCPDHRDKQAGRPCLACSIEKAEALLRELLNGKWCTPEYNDARQRAAYHLGGDHD